MKPDLGGEERTADASEAQGERHAASGTIKEVELRKMEGKLSGVHESSGFSDCLEFGTEIAPTPKNASKHPLKGSKEKTAAYPNIFESKEVAKVMTKPEAQEATEPPLRADKEQTAIDVQQAGQRIQDICKQLTAIDKLEIERKQSWWQNKELVETHAVWKRNALANLKAAATPAEELYEKITMIEAAQAASEERTTAESTDTPPKSHPEGVDADMDWVLIEDVMASAT